MSTSATGGLAVSIVIPAPDDAAALEATLVSVLENRPDASEVVVAHGFPYADPWGIGDEVRLVPAPPGSGLAACANVGVAASTAAAVHLLAAGWTATPGWTDEPLALLGDPGVKAVAPVGVAAGAAATPLMAGVRLTRGGRRVAVVPRRHDARSGRLDVSRLWPAAPALEAGFWRAESLAAVGPGFATCCGDWLADADMAAALACLPGRVAVAAESRVVCGPGRRRPRAFTAGLQAERLFWRSLARGSVAAALVSHGIEVVRDAVAAPLRAPAMLAGRIAAFLQFGAYAPRFVRLRAVRANRGDGSDTLRIDGPHARIARPRRPAAEPERLRRSA